MSAAAAKPTLRRWTWCRLHREVIQNDLWALVAEMANSDVPIVEAMVTRLDLFASENQPRGSVEGFSVLALAARWGRDKDELARVLAALEHPDVGWIEQDHVVSFWARNPDHEDPNAKARQQRRRDRSRGMKLLKQMRAEDQISHEEYLARVEALQNCRDPAALVAAWQLSTGHGHHAVTARDSVTVTTRAEQSRKTVDQQKQANVTAEAVQNDSSESAEIGSDELWLAVEGRRIVTERAEVIATRAQAMIARWLARPELSGDAGALRTILAQCERSDYIGGRFHNQVVDAIGRWGWQQQGPQLPLLQPLGGDRKRGHG